MKHGLKGAAVRAMIAALLIFTVPVPLYAEAPLEETLRIGVSIESTTDSFGTQCKQLLDQAAKVLGVQIQYVDQGGRPDMVADSVTLLCEEGCRGIILCNSDDSDMASAISTCEEKGVYLAQFFRTIDSEDSADIYKLAEKSDYYVGAVHEDEEQNGKELTGMLLRQGSRNIGLIGPTMGDAVFGDRWNGVKAAVDEWNAENPGDAARLTEPVYAGTTSEGGASAARSLMQSATAIDGLISAGGGEVLQGVTAALEGLGKTDSVAVVSAGFVSDLGDKLMDGSIAGASGGNFYNPLFAFMMVYQAVSGTYGDLGGVFHDFRSPYLYVSSSEDYTNYIKYFVLQLPFTDDELSAMSEASYEELQASADSLLVENAAKQGL